MTVDFAELSQSGKEVGKISVPINYDIIHLFSNGLYKSPNKAVEELVTNSYDADARHVHVLLPDAPDGKAAGTTPLWVIDDGHGMNTDGFRQLWRIAESNKKSTSPCGREPIGQFGIGKLAAYVLAQKLTHISKSQNSLCLTTMDFGSITGRYNDDQQSEQKLSLREVDEPTAKRHLAEIRKRDPGAWNLMFDRKSGASTWTAAALSNFKELYRRLSSGSLRWVLRTGLPLHTNFQLFLDGDPITSSKESIPEIARVDIDESISTIGQVKGCAVIYKNQLTTGKSQKTGRSHGFFIRVRERVINLEDELFGIEQPNHAAWSRFAMNISADGLRDHLLSSREGVRDSDDIRQFRTFLVSIFNKCRAAYDDWNRKNNEKLDIADLLSKNPSPQIVDPLFRGVRNSVQAGAESFYIGHLKDVEGSDRDRWLDTYRKRISTKPFENSLFEHRGRYFPALTYEPNTRALVVNIDHPFVDKLTVGGRNRDSAMLFASSEVLLEGQLSEQGIARDVIASFLEDRDRVLRLTAGAGEPTTAADVLSKLELASDNAMAMERAVGSLFRALGFRYDRKGGHGPEADGVLYARLGMQRGSLMDYKVVYDTKTTNEPSVSSDKINVSALESHRVTAGAEYGFFAAVAYDAEKNDDGAINKNMRHSSGARLTLLTVKHMRKLIDLHFEYGLTLSKLRTLFDNARTVKDVDQWLDSTRSDLSEEGQVPLHVLFNSLEEEKSDTKAAPNVRAVRAKNKRLEEFTPEKLIARLRAVQTILGNRWIEVIDGESGDVIMHHSAPQVIQAFKREIGTLDIHCDETASGPT